MLIALSKIYEAKHYRLIRYAFVLIHLGSIIFKLNTDGKYSLCTITPSLRKQTDFPPPQAENLSVFAG